MKTTLVFVTQAFLYCVLTINVAWAKEGSEFQPTMSVGVEGGYQIADDSSLNQSDPSGGLWGIFGGYFLDPSWRLEAGYQYQNELTTTNPQVKINNQFINFSARYDWPIQDGLNVYGRFGLSYWDLTKTFSSLETIDANGLSPSMGIGLSYRILPTIELTTGYAFQYGIGNSTTGEYDNHQLLLSIAYLFEVEDESQLLSSKDEQNESGKTEPKIAAESIDIVVPSDNSEVSNTTIKVKKTVTTLYTLSVFDFDKYKPNSDISKKLSQISKLLQENKNGNIKVVGYTDSIGNKKYNLNLSLKRANEIANLLIEKGVVRNRLIIIGKGENNPIASNNKKEGRVKNRRVEVFLTPLATENNEK
ncbi:OmpA family protein [Vibrio marisflavi]|nr:OmpA family protein [Vibrio marisflavi]